MPQVSYKLLVDGEPPDPALLDAVQQVQVEDHASLAGIVRLRLGTGVEAGGGGWSVLDGDAFGRLTPLRVQARVGTRLETLADAYVVERRAVLGDRPGDSHVDVVAVDATVLMNLEERLRAWPDMSDAGIASEVFGEHGLEADVEETEPTRQEDDATTMQRDTDVRFLRRLARRNGCDCYVETDPDTDKATGHFHKPRLDAAPQGTLTVNMGNATNVDRFEVRHHMMHPAVAEAHGLDAMTLEVQSAEATNLAATTLGARSVLPDGPARRVVLRGTGLSAGAELGVAAQALVDRSGWSVVAEGECNVASYPAALRAKRNVLVRGVGRSLGGTYRVQRVLHTFSDDGYTQQFTLHRNATGLDGGEDFTTGAGA